MNESTIKMTLRDYLKLPSDDIRVNILQEPYCSSDLIEYRKLSGMKFRMSTVNNSKVISYCKMNKNGFIVTYCQEIEVLSELK